MAAKSNESVDFGRLLIFGLIAGAVYYFFFGDGKIKPFPGPEPTPIVSNDFVEPPAYIKNLLPEVQTKISGRSALDLAYLYKNMAGEVRHNNKVTTLSQIVNKHNEIGKSVERNSSKDFKTGLADDLNKFMLSDVVAGKVQNNLSQEDKEKIAVGFDAIAWALFQSAGEEGLRDFHAAFYNCDENGCPKDEQKYLDYIKNISNSATFEEKVDSDGKLLLMQSVNEDANQVRGPPIDPALTQGLIVNPTAIAEFNKSIPKFQQFGYDGSGEGKTVLLYESLLKYDPEAFTERQSTGDCGIAWDNNMGLYGTKVLMASGERKPIEDVKVGDQVINAYNEVSEVKTVFKKPYTGDLIEIQLAGDYNIATFTPDHLFLTCNEGNFIWKRLDQITKKDLLLVPFGNQEEKEYTFDLQTLSLVDLENNPRRTNSQNGYVRMKGGRHHIKRYITLDEDLGWLFGIFFAEGGIRYENNHPMGVDFSLNRNETFFAEEIQRICKEKFDYDVKFYDWDKKPNVRIVRINSAIIGEFFYNQCPGKIDTKSLTTCIFQSPLEVRRAVLKGWFDGDGHISKSNILITSTSISEQLVNDMSYLAKSLKIDNRILHRKGIPNKGVMHRRDSYWMNIYSSNQNKIYPNIKIANNPRPEKINAFGIERTIKSIRRIPVENIDVYCIEVPNKSSFIANGIAVHNCTSHGTRNAVDIARAYEIDKLGEQESFVARGATEAIYGYRGHAGQGMSVDRAMKYINSVGGIALRKNYTDLGIDFSRYDPKEATQWGRSGGTPDRLNQAIKPYQVQNIALVNSAEEARDAISNGFAIVSGSLHEFPSKRDQYGIAKRNGRAWAHCIAWGAVATLSDLTDGKVDSQEPYFLYINSWGPNWIAGPKGKYSSIPDGSFWISKDDAKFIIRQQQTYAVGQCVGYPAEKRTTFGFEWLD